MNILKSKNKENLMNVFFKNKALMKISLLSIFLSLNAICSSQTTNNDKLIPTKKDGKSGYTDRNGNWVIPPQFYSAYEFNDHGFARVTQLPNVNKNEFLDGYIDKKGKIVIPIEIEYTIQYMNEEDVVIGATNFHGNKSPGLEGVKVFLAHADGKKIPLESNMNVFYAGEGLYVINGNRYINKYGKVAITSDFISAGVFKNGRAIVRTREKKNAVIDTKGKIISYLEYDNFHLPDQKLYTNIDVTLDGKKGIIDNGGNVLIPCIYDELFKINPDTIRVLRNGVYSLINYEGKPLKEKIIYSYNDFSEGLCLAQTHTSEGFYNKVTKKKNGFIDKNENIIIPFTNHFSEVRAFKEGAAAIGFGYGECGFLDKQGNIFIKGKYHEVTDFSNGTALVRQYKKWGSIDMSGEVILPINYTKDGAQGNIEYYKSYNKSIIEAKRSASPAKSLSSLVSKTIKDQKFKSAMPGLHNYTISKIYNELGWEYYHTGAFANAAKHFGLSKNYAQKDNEALFGEALSMSEEGKTTNITIGKDDFNDIYLQALKNIPQNKKTNIEYKTYYISQLVYLAANRAIKRKDYNSALNIMNNVEKISGLKDIVWQQYFYRAHANDINFFTFKDLISNVYPESAGINFNIDYFDEEQLRVFFARMDQTTIPDKTLLRFKSEILNRLPTINSDLCYEYEKQKFDSLIVDNIDQYRDYIKRFPNSQFSTEIKTKLQTLDEKMFTTALNSEGTRAYLKYLFTFPDGLHVAEAKSQMAGQSESFKNKVMADQKKAAEQEIDNINNYITVENSDIFFAQGDGLSFWE